MPFATITKFSSSSTCIVVVSVLAFTSACAGRDANPVVSYQTYDSGLSCEQIEAEIIGNEAKALQLIEEDESAHNANVAIGVVGALLFWPALFALDVGDAEMTEMRALKDRNNRLLGLAESKDCGLEIEIAPVEEQAAEKQEEAPIGPRYQGAGQMR